MSSIAQEVELIIPEVVSNEKKTAMKSIEYQKNIRFMS
jgi:hypothetical protein